MPTPFLDALFLTALLVPFAMSLTGLIVLMISLAVKHLAATRERPHSTEALAH